MPATKDECQNDVFSCALRALKQICFAGCFQCPHFTQVFLARDQAKSIVAIPLSSVIPEAEASGIE